MPDHPCWNHIDGCRFVIDAGGDTAQRIRAEVAADIGLRAAVREQSATVPTLVRLMESAANCHSPVGSQPKVDDLRVAESRLLGSAPAAFYQPTAEEVVDVFPSRDPSR